MLAKKLKFEVSKVSSKGQITIPQAIREFLSIEMGDSVSYIVNGNEVILKKAEPLDIEYLKSLESTLSEWSSEGDNDAYNNL